MSDTTQYTQLTYAVETSETPESKVFNEVMREEGVKAGLAWRAKRLEETP